MTTHYVPFNWYICCGIFIYMYTFKLLILLTAAYNLWPAEQKPAIFKKKFIKMHWSTMVNYTRVSKKLYSCFNRFNIKQSIAQTRHHRNPQLIRSTKVIGDYLRCRRNEVFIMISLLKQTLFLALFLFVSLTLLYFFSV